MALPKLKTPTYELELPSTGEKVKYRPFLVKEQKLLMIAQESEEENQIEQAFGDIITSCTFGEIDPYKIPLFDVEYIFLKIRGKSVGDNVELNVLCPDDNETRVPVKIELDKVEVLMKEEHTNEVSLTDDISLIMKYPTLNSMSGFNSQGEVISIFDMVKNCIDEIHSGEEIYNSIDVTDKELEEFIESMSTQNFDDIGNFFDTMPKLQHVVKVKNPKTKKKGEIVLEGMQSFFE